MCYLEGVYKHDGLRLHPEGLSCLWAKLRKCDSHKHKVFSRGMTGPNARRVFAYSANTESLQAPPATKQELIQGTPSVLLPGPMILKESDVRQAVAVALTASMAVPQASWCRGFVEESILADLTAAQEASTSTATDAASNSTSTGPAPELANPDAGSVLELSPDVLDLVEQYQQATADAHPSSSESAPARQPGKASSTRGSKKSRAATGTAAIVQGSTSSSHAEVQAVTEKLQAMFGQLLQDNYLQVEDADVAVFSLKLLQELSHLVEAAVSAQQEDVEGLCQLCEREMPLTKHHFIPRDVHKDFKKRGFGFTELQSGVMVCRPCHSAIHRAVPDNKELGLHFRTLEALRQHKEIASSSLWARRQRVTSKADVGSAHFKYRR